MRSFRQSDDLNVTIGLCHLACVPQLFYLIHDKKFALLVAKIVDEPLTTGEALQVLHFVEKFESIFKFGTPVSGPGVFNFFVLTLELSDDYSSTINVNIKLKSLKCFPLSCVLRCQRDSQLLKLQLASFMTVNSSIKWLRIAASSLCAFYASHLQGKKPAVTLSVLRSQTIFF